MNSNLKFKYLTDTVNKLDLSRLTFSGSETQHPLLVDDKTILYFKNTYDESSKIMIKNITDGTEKVAVDFAGENYDYDVDQQLIIYSKIGLVEKHNYFSDLYLADLKIGEDKKLSYGARIADPVFGETPTEVFAIKNDNNENSIVRFDLDTRKTQPLVVEKGAYITDLLYLKTKLMLVYQKRICGKQKLYFFDLASNAETEVLIPALFRPATIRITVYATNAATIQTLTATVRYGTANTNGDAAIFTQASF